MNIDRHRRALQLCGEAMERMPAEREAWLAAELGDDGELGALVRALLARVVDDDEPESLLQATAGPALAIGSEFAGYHIERLLGEGGMGTVYLARRDDGGVIRRVALKTMQRLRPGASELERFASEQRALAELHHPYIAALVDIGVSSGGAPYLAMEYVPGIAIDAYCDARRASLDARIELFVKLCDAVQYAHRNLVVHRDIKPANVLVSDEGLPKLLDFGVARLLAAGNTEATAAFARHLTLDYATPERILRGTVSTVEDVYALGALLYELLVGVRAFARGDREFGDLARRLESEHVPPPVQALDSLSPEARQRCAGQRSLSVRQLRLRLQGDIAAVLDRALHPDPARRYESVEQLVDEVRRWERGMPVVAHRDSLWYRGGKFLGRHMLAVSAIGLAALARVVALGISIVQTRMANLQLERAVAVSAFLQELLAAPSARWDTAWRGNADVSMDDVLDLAVTHLDNELEDQPEVRVELYTSIARGYIALDRLPEALAVQRKAQALVERALPIDSPLQERSSTALAIILDYQRTPEALREAREHLARSLRWLEQHSPDAHFDRAIALGELGLNYRYSGEYLRAAAMLEEALAMGARSGAPEDHPAFALGWGLLGLARFEAHDLARARPALERSVAITRGSSEAPTSDTIDAFAPLAFIRLVEGRGSEALALSQDALDIALRTTGRRSISAAEMQADLAFTRLSVGDVAGARAAFDAALATAPEGGRWPPYLTNAIALVRAELAVGEGRAADAQALLAPISHLRNEPMLRRDVIDARGRWLLASGRAHLLQGDMAVGGALLREAHRHRSLLFGANTPIVRGLGAEIRRAGEADGSRRGGIPVLLQQ